MLLGRYCLDQHGGDDEDLGGNGDSPGRGHFYDTHLVFLCSTKERSLLLKPMW